MTPPMPNKIQIKANPRKRTKIASDISTLKLLEIQLKEYDYYGCFLKVLDDQIESLLIQPSFSEAELSILF